MKKFLLPIFVCTTAFLWAQTVDQSIFKNSNFQFSLPPNNPPENVVALWDIQFDYTINNDTITDLAATVHFNDEFWIAEWNSSNIARLDNAGNVLEIFTIPSIFGVRAMTWDGTSLWLANNTQTIFEINPSDKTIISTVEIPFADNVRFLTYDETADGGNGGFWVGNFSSDIALFSKQGTLLLTIPIDTHTLTEIYGAAVDNISQGGPYLWAFQQAGGDLNGLIVQLQLPEGIPTGVARDVQIDLNTEGGLAGGLFLTDSWNGELTLGGILQISEDFDRLFGYELSFETSDNVDVKVLEITAPNSDCQLTNEETLTVLIENNGPVATSNIPLEIFQNEQLITTEIVPDTIESGETFAYTFNQKLDLSAIDFYDLKIIAAANSDVNNSNNQVEKTVSNRPIVAPPLEISFDDLPLDTTVFPNFYNVGDLPFRVNTGATVSLGTGPAGNASGGDGHYIYMESSDGAVGSQAILTTSCVDLGSFENPAVIFAYHAYGDGIGFLKVEVLDEMGELHELFLVENQQQTASSDAWNLESLSLNAFAGQQIEIIFTGTIGATGQFFNADIALDEISIGEIVAVEESVAKAKISIFPNPVSEQLFINLNFEKPKMATFQLSNSLGQIVFETEEKAFLNENFAIDVSDFETGIYFLKIDIEGKNRTWKIFIN